MTNPREQPIRQVKVFISSVSKEFRDLREALRHSLEQLGVSVFVSEAADFPIEGDRSAVEECLNNVRKSDVFVLIVGGQTGTVLNDDASVTRHEFHEAKRHFGEHSHPIIRSFIRRQVVEAIENDNVGSSRIEIDNEDHLREFIGEIQEGESQNYLTRFSEFSDIMDSVKDTLNLGRNLEESIVRHLLVDELAFNLSKLLERRDRMAYVGHRRMKILRDSVALTSDDVANDTMVTLTANQRAQLALALSLRRNSVAFRTRVALRALTGGVFVEFDPASQRMRSAPLHNDIEQLLSDFHSLSSLDSPKLPEQQIGHWSSKLLYEITRPGRRGESISVLASDLVWAFSYFDIIENIFNGMSALLARLRGADGHVDIERTPITPLGDEMAHNIRTEQVDPDEVIRMMDIGAAPFGARVPEELSDDMRELYEEIGDRVREYLLSTGKGADEVEAAVRSFSEMAAEVTTLDEDDALELRERREE